MSIDEIIYGDCISEMNDIPTSSIDLILTDPPYGISRSSRFIHGGSWNNSECPQSRKTPPKTEFGEWDKDGYFNIDGNNEIMKAFKRVLKPGGTAIIFYDIWKMGDLKALAEHNGFKQFRLCVWHKTNPVPINSKLNYLSNSSEYFMTFVKGSKPCFHSEYDKGIYSFPICSGHERTNHPTQKPLPLISELIEKHSNAGDIVLDPFMGSGTTAIAALETGRHFIGYENNEQYYNLCTERMNSFYNSMPTTQCTYS